MSHGTGDNMRRLQRMCRRAAFAVIPLVCSLSAAAAESAARPVPLARDGKALVSIRIAPEASGDLRNTASNLAAMLTRIADADFQVVESRQPGGLTLGIVTQFPDNAVAEAIAVRNDYDGVEAYAIRTDAQGVRLLANTDLGASHAAHRLLEQLGCRWFFQGPAWEIVPHTPDLSFGGNETARPDIQSRVIWFSRTAQPWEKGDPNPNAAFDRWARGNRLGISLKFNVSHNWHAIPAAFKDDGFPYKKEFESHPEYFALVKGKRTPPQFCVANPDLQKLVIRYANRYFEKNPEADMVSLDPADQGGWCTCAECEKLGSYPCQPFFLANVVAKELRKTHPGKFTGLLAYSWHSDAPSFAMEPNVYVQLTAGMNASAKSFDELFQVWTARCRGLGIYEYLSYWEMDKCMLPGSGPHNNFDTLAPRITNYVANGVRSISGQAASCWGVNGLGYYLLSKLMWDSAADTKAILEDFYEKAFGPAAVPMERYFERLNLAGKPMPGATLLRQCLDDLEEATRLAAGRPDVLARLTQLQESLVYSAIGLKVNTTAGREHQTNLLEWFTWSYRTRNNYMNDWITFRSSVGHPAADELGLTNWFWRNTRANPWRNEQPVMPAELNARLTAIKAELGELPTTPPRTFSNRFVLVKTAWPGNSDVHQLHSGKATYLMASTNGEALRLTVTKRDTGDMEKPTAKYSLTAQDGTVITNGGLDTGRHELALNVPQPGVYRFTCSRGGTGWEVDFPEETTRALLFERGEKCNPKAIRTAWFYVPKGTPEIVMYTAPSSAPVVCGPDNRVAHKGTSEGRFIVIKVQPGEDGKLWSIRGRPTNLWFFNVPTVLTFRADRFFVPVDVAQRDGLTQVSPSPEP